MFVVDWDQKRFHSSVLPVNQQTGEDDSIQRCTAGNGRGHKPGFEYEEASSYQI